VHNEKTGLNHVSYEAQDIDAVFQDHDGRVWVGTESGMNRYDAGSWSHYLDGTNGIGPFEVRGTLEDLKPGQSIRVVLPLESSKAILIEVT
jgi:ligand-binding sensor domain-containing protein